MIKKEPTNLHQKFNLFSEQWSPKIIAQMNNYHFKLAKIQGEFTWHSHPETDEVFFVVAGEMAIAFRDSTIHLKAGDLYVVPKGVEHKPYAAAECQIMLVELAGTLNTGDTVGDLTAANDVWI